MCRGKKNNYMICPWLMNFKEEVECEWKGRTLL